VSFKTTPFRSSFSSFFFFFFFGMKRRRFRQNAPFHLSPARRQNASICKAALNYLLSFNCIPANFGLRPYSWPRFSLWSLASDLCNWALNWLINFQFLQLGPWTE
jgi:hypothetical protein